jgi:hypothetical protein
MERSLQELKSGVDDPRKGAELIAAFYETDESVLGNCDDSTGFVGDVYRFDARELFVSYACRCTDKEWLGSLLLKLCCQDEYGIRSSLVDDASKYLTEEIMRGMVFRLWSDSDRATKAHTRKSRLHLVESLARQLRDAPLFEKARRKAWPNLSAAACEDIARVYQESGRPAEALSWLEKIPSNEDFRAYDRDRLLLQVYGELGDEKRRIETAWRIFRSHRSKDTMKILLSIIGADQKERVIEEETADILRTERLSYSDAEFLVEAGRIVEAETYIIKHREQLNGDFYRVLLPLAKRVEKKGRVLAASLLYRALLDSIFKRALSKYYTYGVRYLRKLDELAGSVQNWSNVPSHAEYLESIRHAHHRKRSFWSRYEASREK